MDTLLVPCGVSAFSAEKAAEVFVHGRDEIHVMVSVWHGYVCVWMCVCVHACPLTNNAGTLQCHETLSLACEWNVA